MNLWESVFTQSPANAGRYDEVDLPYHNWDWPKGTWFQARLDHLREQGQLPSLRLGRKMGGDREMRAL